MINYNDLLNDKSFSGIIVVLDNKSNIINANSEFLSLLGFSLDELEGKHLTDLIVPDEKSLFFDLVFTQDISNNMTLKFYHKSGAFRFFSFSIISFNDYKILFGNTLKKEYLAKKYEYITEQNSVIKNIFENIDAKDIRDILSFQENSLSLLLDLMPIEVWVKDKLGKYVFINKTYSNATGIAMSDCAQKDDYQLFSSDTAQSFVESDELAKKSGKRISFSFETKDISMASFAEVTKIPIYNNLNEYIGMIAFSINTSHIKASEFELERENKRLMFILDNLGGIVFEVNPQNKLIFVSGKLKELLGFDMDNDSLMDLFLSSDKTSEAREKLKLALNGQKVVINSDIFKENISFTLNPVKNNDGTFNIIGFGNIVLNGVGFNGE